MSFMIYTPLKKNNVVLRLFSYKKFIVNHQVMKIIKGHLFTNNERSRCTCIFSSLHQDVPFQQSFSLFFFEKPVLDLVNNEKEKKNLLAVARKTLQALQCLLFLCNISCFLTTSYHNRTLRSSRRPVHNFLKPSNSECFFFFYKMLMWTEGKPISSSTAIY